MSAGRLTPFQFSKKDYRLEIQSGKPNAESGLFSRLFAFALQTNIAILKN
jgi:hypothetical protein